MLSNCLLSLPYRDGRRHLQSCKDHKLAIPYIHILHVLYTIYILYIPAYINGLAPVGTLLSHLHSLPFHSRRWQPIARTIWRAHHHHDSLLPQSEEYPTALYVCMYLSMFVYMYVYYMYLCLK